jgi:hypothetical protein
MKYPRISWERGGGGMWGGVTPLSPLDEQILKDDVNGFPHRLNMELDLQSFSGLHVHSCTHWLRPAPIPRFCAHIRGRYWSANYCRRHLFVTHWFFLLLGYVRHGYLEKAEGWIINKTQHNTTLSFNKLNTIKLN